MSQAIDSSFAGGGNAYPVNFNPASALKNGAGSPSDTGSPNGSLDNGAPLLGSMQGFGGVDGFNSSCPSEQNLSNLLNIGPLQQQADQMSQGTTANPSSPLNYVNSTLTPIMSGAQQSYKQAMPQPQQSPQSDKQK